MSTLRRTFDDPLAMDTADFSLVLGGPLFQIWRRSHMVGDALELLHRRIVAFVVLAWVPLLLLSIVEGHVWWASASALPFLYDVEVHVRLLCALPLLILAEKIVHQRMRPVIRQFLARNLIPDAARATFDAAVASALRLRNSVGAEVALIVFVLVAGVFVSERTQVVLASASWYALPTAGGAEPTMAGWWLRWVSLPLFQFVLLRWYFRLFIWARFLWQISRIDLKLMPTHPDRSGGLGFVAGVSNAFVPVLSAQGAVLAGLMANRIFYAGATLPQFKLELVGLVGVMVFAILGPLLVFSPKLAAAKRLGSREYGILAQRYVREFDQKWLRGGAPADEPFIGSADIQSLADLGNSFEVIKEMKWVPFSTQTVLQLSVATLLPALPLMLTLLSLEELVERLLKIVF